jgi:hypothetical protein
MKGLEVKQKSLKDISKNEINILNLRRFESCSGYLGNHCGRLCQYRQYNGLQ